jgi:hypothetical protein
MSDTIQRVRDKTGNFSIILNECFQRADLSARAKGIFGYIMTLPDSWKIRKVELYSHFTEGRDALDAAFKELEAAGYIESKEVREAGKFAGFDYTVNESCGKPAPGKPYTVKPVPENPHLLKTDLSKDLRKVRTKEREESEAFASPPPPPVRIGNDGTSRFERAKTAGEGLFPPVRKNLLELKDDDRREIIATLSHYSDLEIYDALENYSSMLKDDQYDIFAPYSSLIGFLRSGVEKFVDEAKPRDVFRKRDPAALEKAERDAVFEQMRKEREETEDDE